MSVIYDRDRHQLTCRHATFDQLVAALRGDRPLPVADQALRDAGVLDGDRIDDALAVPISAIAGADHEGVLWVGTGAGARRHRFWLTPAVQAWWVDGGEGEGRLFALPAELFAHNVVDLAAFRARRVPGADEPEIPASFEWSPSFAGARVDVSDQVVQLAQEHREREFREALDAGAWTLWHVEKGDRELTVFDTLFATYVLHGDQEWNQTSGRSLWETLIAWVPGPSHLQNANPFGSRP